MADMIELEGEVVDSSKGIFKVKVNESHTAICTLGGKVRVNSVKILIGDKVKIEVSPYDTSRGRIIYRSKS
jgi:translation initiation factor IF-1